MLAADRGATGETMHKVASETSWTFDGLCIRAAGIEHCSDIVSGGSGEGSTEPWSCVPGTRPISHLDLTIPDDLLDSVDVPSALRAMSEMTAGIDRYMRNWTDALRGAMGLPTPERPEHDQLPARDCRHGSRHERISWWPGSLSTLSPSCTVTGPIGM